MKRILLTVLAITLCLTIFSGCNKDSVSDKSIILTIAETEPSCPAFESNCFYAYDAEGVIYRVLWTNFTDLNEKDTVVVEYNKKEKLNISADIAGGFHAKFEITATGIYSVDEWNDIIGNSSPAEYFQLQKNDNGVIIFNVIAGFPQAKYTFKDTDAEEYVGIALDNENGEINSLLFGLLNGKSTVSDEGTNAFTHSISMTCSYTSDDGYSEITVVYEFKWASTSNTITIFKNNTLVGTVLLSDDEMSSFKNTLNNLQ